MYLPESNLIRLILTQTQFKMVPNWCWQYNIVGSFYVLGNQWTIRYNLNIMRVNVFVNDWAGIHYKKINCVFISNIYLN